METADVVIIGGGIVGASIAWHLTEAGCRNVLMVERESHQGKGSTGKSMGGVRAQFATKPNIQMSLYSIPFYAAFEERLGQPCGYRPQGYMFVATKPSHLEYLQTNQALQKSLGLKKVGMITRDEIVERVPQLRSDDILGGSFCPTDGFVDPNSVMVGFTTARLRARRKDMALDRGHGDPAEWFRHSSVETTRGPVSTRMVVNAAGAWAARSRGAWRVRSARRAAAPHAGSDRALRRRLARESHGHRHDERLSLPAGEPRLSAGVERSRQRPSASRTTSSRRFIEKMLERAADRVPCFENLAINPKRAWAGLYEMSPDHHGILGPVPGLDGFFCANGFSGHGVMHAPATGKILADLITNGEDQRGE